MLGRRVRWVLLSAALLLSNIVALGAPYPFGDDSLSSRQLPVPSSAEIPDYTTASHNIGKLVLGVSNYGTFYNGTYPRKSGIGYLSSGGIWIGCVRGSDSL